MRLWSHFSVSTLSNTYLLGPDKPGDAVLVDPASFDVGLLELIEEHRYYVRSVLLTHCDEAHLDGLVALRRIYTDCAIHAAVHHPRGFDSLAVADGDALSLVGESLAVIALPGHGRDALAFYGSGFLFTGQAMSAGEYGRVANPYAKAILLADIHERLLSLPERTVILPFYGPPTTVAVERQTFPREDPLRTRTLFGTVPEAEP